MGPKSFGGAGAAERENIQIGLRPARIAPNLAAHNCPRAEARSHPSEPIQKLQAIIHGAATGDGINSRKCARLLKRTG